MEKIYNYIDGDVAAPAEDRWLDVFEPATGQAYARAPDSSADDLKKAMSAAQSAFDPWAATSAAERGRVLNRLANLVEERAAEFAQAESVDTGKPLRLAESVDIPRVAANLRFYAGAAEHFASESHAMGQDAINYTLREPLGVVACISPWNLPLYLLSWKIAPALAAGNTVIAKPSELTPMTAYLFSRLLSRANVPPGVLNIVHGRGAGVGQALVDQTEIAAISFTGGTSTGKQIAKSTAGRFKKLSLEMGGKNPTVVFADCDWDRTLDQTLRAAFTNQGEVCLCGSRILVQNEVYERFREDFVARAKQLVVGDPLVNGSDQGALISAAHRDKVLDCIQLAQDEGGEVLCGGTPVNLPGRCAEGWFVAPTVIEGLPAQCRTNQEEIFGPVVTIMPFDDEDEAIALSNQSTYGLAASIWGSDVTRCLRVARRIEAGLVWVNTWMMRDLRTPMGGMKQSGMGREGGFESMRFFTEPKNVCVRYD
ncbi:MAG: aldehyde dehydrogenase [Gammaproteobacteria bacterium]|nr:aldehyde dehydrogenase [Gammaproteobacteria bacterium]MDH3767045.1 aldehyde dehydrogenase [Gammaproteobacteria bacterium]